MRLERTLHARTSMPDVCHQPRPDAAPAASHALLPVAPVHVRTVNLCGRRLLQVERLRGYLLGNGYPLTPSAQDAHYVLVVGCAFNDHTERVSTAVFDEHRRSLRAGQRLFALEGIADICGPTWASGGICDPDHTIPTTRFDRLDRFFARRHRFDDTPEANVPGQCDGVRPGAPAVLAPRRATSPADVFSIQVGTGCVDHCTYCGDKPIVGDLRSRPLPGILAQVRLAASLGYESIELIGDDVGCYGIDIGSGLPDLLDAVAAEPNVRRLSLLEINVRYLARHEAFLRTFLPRRVLTKVAVAFQSGSDRVLDLMGRGYDADDVRRLARLLTDNGVWKHAHVIVGFPTETPDEFSASCALLLEGGFESATLFLYQDRPGTLAAGLEPKVPLDEQRRRLEWARVRLADAGFVSNAREDKLQVCRQPAPQ